MIKDVDGNKTTPKKMAQDLIMNKLSICRGYWTEGYESDSMTEKEIQKVNEQLQKECDRIAKKFGFDKSWIS